MKLLVFMLTLEVITVSGLNTDKLSSGNIRCKQRTCISVDDRKQATAYGQYDNALLETGWGVLEIVAGKGAPASNDDIMFASGMLEGMFTADQIYEHYKNMHATFFGNKKSSEYEVKARKFMMQQDAWMRQMVEKNPSDPLWRHVGYVLAQFDGLVAGYNQTASPDKALDVFAFQVLNGVGDLLDLRNALLPDEIPDWTKMTKTEAFRYIRQNSHCSALIKVLGAYENLFMSHSSWFVYAAMLRIYKHYDFNVADQKTSAKRISFSSYPGFLESLDDFYLLGSQMVMLQTTNNVFNKTLFSAVKPNSLLAWQRVRVANMMANSGKEWATALSRYNSGTYNNQYMVVDLKKIQLGSTILDDALWVVEQIPTLVKSGDQTAILRTGYWPSYNVPFYEEIYQRSGYPDFVAQHGSDFSYQLAPRAKIFRRDEGKVVDLASMKHIMRYNNYKHDPYSEDMPCNTICCRGDLDAEEPAPDGCYDTKVADFNMALNLTADVINGPTLGTSLPPFKWTPKFNVSHVGLPPVYDFKFLRTRPSLEKP
ncbi:phospholipase B-like 1 [Haliotis rubra]|uniref:phospholipase B-like 1 n=1 Tax=Haliotis rubra TaxID=36100 RepID=UPI001EE5F10A|nr:phospholipase B-like 1 [Haliotis rubra]XP_046581882.1 phospholipase B-like 1 [Haliotis rubra]